jgi:hypothetical protein
VSPSRSCWCLGLAAISPFANAGASATGFGISTAIGLIVVQWLASASGGFITGRLRTKWVGVHTHEVFFRDTAHGLLTWTLATLVTIMLVVSAASSVIGGGARATAAIGGSLDQAASPAISQAMTGTRAYDVDRLFRSDRPDPTANAQNANAQATRILAEGLVNGDVPAADRSYLAQIITLRTGISQADAEQRVDSVIAREKAVEVKARQAADTARKAASELAIFTALSMLIGAFIACVAAAYGGNVRDEF